MNHVTHLSLLIGCAMALVIVTSSASIDQSEEKRGVFGCRGWGAGCRAWKRGLEKRELEKRSIEKRSLDNRSSTKLEKRSLDKRFGVFGCSGWGAGCRNSGWGSTRQTSSLTKPKRFGVLGSRGWGPGFSSDRVKDYKAKRFGVLGCSGWGAGCRYSPHRRGAVMFNGPRAFAPLTSGRSWKPSGKRSTDLSQPSNVHRRDTADQLQPSNVNPRDTVDQSQRSRRSASAYQRAAHLKQLARS